MVVASRATPTSSSSGLATRPGFPAPPGTKRRPAPAGGRASGDAADRDVGLAVPRLARGLLPRPPPDVAVAGALRHPVRDGRGQQHVLPAPRARPVRRVA